MLRSTKRIIFINRFFFPDYSATSQLVSDLAFHLSACGREVHVITSQQLYSDPGAMLPNDDVVKGVRICRVRTTRFGRATLLGRGIDYLSFYASAYRALTTIAERGDIVVAKTDPPLLSVIAMNAASRRGAHLVNWLQDIFPEVAVQLRLPFLHGPARHALAVLRDMSLRAARMNVAISDRMAERLMSLGIGRDRVQVIHNWTDDEEIGPVDHAGNPLRRTWGLADKFVVGYSGNLGRAHEFETVLAAAERLRAFPHICFLFIGGGHGLEELVRRVKERRLDASFRFVSYQDRAQLKYSLGVPDIHWVSLKPELEGLIFPSKFYGAAAAGRPIIAISAEDGDLARLVRQHQCGLVIRPGDGDALAAALIRASADGECTVDMGRRARAMLDEQFSCARAFEHWRGVFEAIEAEDAATFVESPAIVPKIL